MLDLPQSDAVIAAALAEDLGVPVERLLQPHGAAREARLDRAATSAAAAAAPLLARDVTSWTVVPAGDRFAGVVRAREAGVVCGLPVIERAYALLSSASDAEDGVEVFPLVAEGADIVAGDAVAEIEGDARIVLAGERTALNLLQTLSGIATEARRWAAALDAEEAETIVLDTRKTLPGLRQLSKYAVRVGGARNHRAGLFDMVLIKDNHLRRAGGVTESVGRARSGAPGLRVEVEADTVEQAVEAARAGADIVLLDNMDDATLAAAVGAVRDAARSAGIEVLTEASGGVRIERLPALAKAGVDRVSASALTLARPLDFGLDEVTPTSA